METTTETTRQDEQPTSSQIAEQQFAADVIELFKAWREAGKPHKR